MDSEEAFAIARDEMVEQQLIPRDINDPRVLQAMRNVPRHRFIPPEHRSFAYADGPLPIGHGQTISQPYIVAFMSQCLDLKGEESVLEVGAGSGYQAAVLACLARQIHTIERHSELADGAAKTLAALGYGNVTMHIGDGSMGLVDLAPFDAIMVTAAAPRAPQALLDQLADNGRMIIPVGSRGAQYLELWKYTAGDLRSEIVLPVAFVPLVGKFGWKE